ncbi:XRE family transcriptional regulator, partial [Mycobacterium sp. 48b]
LTVPLSITVTLAPGNWAHEDFDKHAPSTYSSSAIEGAIESAVMATPTPAALPGSPLERLEASRKGQ